MFHVGANGLCFADFSFAHLFSRAFFPSAIHTHPYSQGRTGDHVYPAHESSCFHQVLDLGSRGTDIIDQGNVTWFLCFCPGKEMVDYICQYLSTVRERQVTPNVQPGYLRAQLPASAPEEPDSWDSIFGDIERIIMPGVRHCRGDSRFQGT